MSQRKKKKSSGGASGASSRKRNDPAKAAAAQRTQRNDRIKAFGVAIVFWALVMVGWNIWESRQEAARDEQVRVFATQSLLGQIQQALSTYAEDHGGGVPQSPDPTRGGVVLFQKLALPKEGLAKPAATEPESAPDEIPTEPVLRKDDPTIYLPVWAGQLSKTGASGETTLVDQWGHPILYLAPGENGERYQLWSSGGDPASPKSQWIIAPPAP